MNRPVSHFEILTGRTLVDGALVDVYVKAWNPRPIAVNGGTETATLFSTGDGPRVVRRSDRAVRAVVA